MMGLDSIMGIYTSDHRDHRHATYLAILPLLSVVATKTPIFQSSENKTYIYVSHTSRVTHLNNNLLFSPSRSRVSPSSRPVVPPPF